MELSSHRLHCKYQHLSFSGGDALDHQGMVEGAWHRVWLQGGLSLSFSHLSSHGHTHIMVRDLGSL